MVPSPWYQISPHFENFPYLPLGAMPRPEAEAEGVAELWPAGEGRAGPGGGGPGGGLGGGGPPMLPIAMAIKSGGGIMGPPGIISPGGPGNGMSNWPSCTRDTSASACRNQPTAGIRDQYRSVVLSRQTTQ